MGIAYLIIAVGAERFLSDGAYRIISDEVQIIISVRSSLVSVSADEIGTEVFV